MVQMPPMHLRKKGRSSAIKRCGTIMAMLLVRSFSPLCAKVGSERVRPI